MAFVVCGVIPLLLAAETDMPRFPRVQCVPLPENRIAFEIDAIEVAQYHYGPTLLKPYIFPLVGPAGRPLVRLTHPHDPHGHRHHLGIWVGHKDVNGASFWEESPDTRVAHQRVVNLTDGPGAASLAVWNRWLSGGGATVLDERRTVILHALDGRECCLDIVMEFTPASGSVTFGKTSFGFLGVRVAKTMSPNDGGGTIRNSEGGVNEQELFWKRARWVDCTGRVTPEVSNGIALFDHPDNVRFPTYYHVRDDGWMGTSFCLEEPYTLPPGETLSLRYRLYAHGPNTTPEILDLQWQRFADTSYEAGESVGEMVARESRNGRDK